MKQEFEKRTQSTNPLEKWSEWVLFTGVDEKTFARDFTSETNGIDDWTGSCPSYDSSLNLLLTKFRFSPHEVARSVFSDLLYDALESMGLKRALRRLGSTTVDGTNGKKEPDCSYAPYLLRGHPSKGLPTVVLEVALSEAESKLSSDVRFWLHHCGGKVKILLILAIDRIEPKITLEKRELWNGCPQRTGRVVISMGADKLINVDGGPLVIELEKLLLRPAGNSKEHDILIDIGMLEWLAKSIWAEQGFIEINGV